MAKMHKVTDKADDLLRDKIACSARGIFRRCCELEKLAMYPHRILSQIKDNIEYIQKHFKPLQDEMNEPQETCFDKDVRKD